LKAKLVKETVGTIWDGHAIDYKPAELQKTLAFSVMIW
jgi:hypothetical protein